MSAQQPSTGVWSRERRALTTGLVLTITLVAFESLAVSTVMPEVSDDLGGLRLYGWVFSGFFLGQLLGIVGAGQMADRTGPARPFLLALVLFGAGLLCAGLAPTMAVLVAARVMQGVGGGAIPAIAYVSVGRGYPADIRPRVFAVFSSAWIVPGLVGPALAGSIAEHLTWRAVFLALLPLVAVAGLLAVPALAAIRPEPGAAPTDRRADAIRVAAGAALVLAAPGTGTALVGVPLALVGGTVGFRAFVRLVPPGTLRARPGLPAAVAARGLLTFAFFGADAYVTLALTSVRGTSTTVGGVALTLTSITWATAAWVQERHVRRLGPRRLVSIGFVLVAVGVGGMLLALFEPTPLALAIGVWSIGGFGIGLAYAPLSLTVLGTATPGTEGDATASLQLSDTLGVALGTGASGAMVAAGDVLGWSARAPLLLAFAFVATIAIGGCAVARQLPTALAAATDATS